MAVSAGQLAFAEELLAELGVSSRRMFGGVGLYAGGVMFGAINDDVIYLKVDEALKADLAAEGAVAWVYTYPSGPKAGQSMDMGYWSLPDAALDDPSVASHWGRRALDVALTAQAAKPSARRKR